MARCRASVSLMSKQGMLLPPRMVSEPIDGGPDGVKTSVAVGALAPSAIATLSSQRRTQAGLEKGAHARKRSLREPPLAIVVAHVHDVRHGVDRLIVTRITGRRIRPQARQAFEHVARGKMTGHPSSNSAHARNRWPS